MMKRLTRILAAVILVLAMLLSTASALTVDEALGILETYYLKELPEEAYEAESLGELFALLGDPYTVYMTEEEYGGFVSAVEGTVEVVGIGVSIQYTPDGILVVEPLEGGPAKEAGILEGDLIIAVDGVSCVPADESHRAMVLGEAGSEVTVTVLRDGETRDYTMKRAQVVIPNTEAEVLDGHIGYITCTSFGSDTGILINECVEQLDGEVDCWLVDLRGNGGGYSDAAVGALGVFTGPGMHLYLQTALGYLYYYEYEHEASTEKPAVLLVDRNSASASEAFAAGMRDHRAAILVGERTYGKGTAQIIFDKESSPELFGEDAMKLTAYRFYSASGITNDGVGVIPTLPVNDLYAYEVAMAICGDPGENPEDTLRLTVDRWNISVDHTAMSREALGALLEAVSPNAGLYLYENGAEIRCTAAEAAQKLGVSYESRWFSDVEDCRYAAALNTLATYGILSGDEEGAFHPDDELTRGEVCTLLGEVLRLEGSGVARFSDLAEDDPNTPYINAMAQLGLVLGRGDGRFYPGETMNQQEFFVLLSRVAEYLSFTVGNEMGQDWQMKLNEAAARGFASWATGAVALLDGLGALNTVSGQPDPFAPVLREEAAANLCSVLISTGVLPG